MVPRTGPKDPAYHSPTVSSFSSPLLLTPGGRGDLPWINNKYNAEKYLEDNHPEIAQFRKDNLYSRECSAVFNEGSVLFYRLDTWHRGTPLIDGKIRRCHNLLYKKSGCTWINQWNTGVARHMYSQQQTVEKLIAGADMQQRTVLGFPAVNSSYWTEYTFAACKERYGALPGGFMYHEEIENELKRRKMNQSSK